MNIPPPLGLLAELTHRCPLRCPYCSNPLELERAGQELPTQTWQSVFQQAAELGVLQLHLSGGEPMVRHDLPQLVAAAERAGLYANLITSAVLLNEERLRELANAGLQHVQISFQDGTASSADAMAGLPSSHAKKLRAAALVKQAGLSLTANIVMTRHNVDRTAELIAFAAGLGADRLELAHTQYHGWALRNMAALLPTLDQLETATAAVHDARERYGTVMPIDYVLPDVLIGRPKPCMQGWGRQFIVVTPSGKALPCHQAASLPDLSFPNVRQTSLTEIWTSSSAFNRFRGSEWMPEPCRSCPSKEIDWGGCRCQAFAIGGNASHADPACDLSPDRDALLRLRAQPATGAWNYRQFGHLAAV